MTEVWCTQDERAAATFRDTVRAEISGTSKERYKMVIFVSGNGDLRRLTAELLKQNK